MAGRKEYEMLWKLNAQLDGSYSRTFKAAQSAMTELQRQMQEMNRTQSDISAFQKQQTAVENTRRKLENLQKQHDLLQKEIAETNGSTTGLEREDLRLEQRISDTSASLERQEERLRNTGDALQEAGVDTGSLTEESARLSAELSELQQREEEEAQSAEEMGESGVSAFAAVGEAIAAAGIAAAVKEIAGAYMECINAAGSFEQAMSNVEALSGASGEEMQALSEKAKELGATTKFTAQESAEAMGYMAMAGWDSSEMLSGMDGVIQLAAASSEDLATVSDIVTDSLSAFGLTAADTAHFSDVLAAAATNSNTDVSIMGETFKQSASVAGALGYSIEDVATAVGLMANSGVKGSIAGTALKNTFNGLLEGVTLTGAAFGEYQYSAVKADGTMKSFGSTISELRGYFAQMTEAEQVNNAMTIAGQRGYNGLLAILNATDADYKSLTESINDCSGAAERMANIKLDNMNGQLTLMQSAWDGLKTSIGEQLSPALSEVYKAGTEALGVLDRFVQQTPGLVQGVTAFAGVLGTAVTALTAYAAIAKVVQVLDIASIFAGPAGMALKVAAGVAAAVGAFTALSTAAKEAQDESWELTAVSREQERQLEELNAEYEEACAKYGETSEEARLLQYDIKELNAAYADGKQTLEEYISEHDELIESYWKQANASKEAYEELEKESGSTDALIAKLTQLSSSSLTAARNQSAIQAIVDELNDSLPELALSYDSLQGGNTQNTIGYIKSVAKAQAEQKKLQQSMSDYGEALANHDVLEEKMREDAENVRLATAEYEEAKELYNSSVSQDNSPNGLVPQFAAMDEAKEQLDAYNEALENSTAAYNDNEQAIQALEEELGVYAEAQGGAAESTATLESATDNVVSRMTALKEAYEQAYTEALESIQGQYAIWDEAAEVIPTSAATVNQAIVSQTDYWREYNENLSFLKTRAGEIQGLGDVIDSFADGSSQSVNIIAGLTNDLKNGNTADVQQMVTNWQSLQKEQNEVSKSLADVKTGIDSELDDILKSYKDTVKEMDLSKDAAKAAEETFDAMVQTANNSIDRVRSAYLRVAQEALAALNSVDMTLPAATVTYNSNGYVSTAALHAEGGIMTTPHLGVVAEAGPEAVIPLSADERERGAELWAQAGKMMGLLQSEAQSAQIVTVYPRLMSALAGRTLAAERSPATGGSYISSPQISFQFTGNVPSETVAAFRSYVESDEFEERILEVTGNAAQDEIRRAYR